jgi:glycosyltransferase involved in cell wall biosynthesis
LLTLDRVRIAIISTPFVPVPPPRYGGTELIVAELVDGFVRQGHEVTLFATGDSRTRAQLRALHPAAEWPPDPRLEQEHAAWAIGEIVADDRGFDVVHAHVPSALPLARFVGVPMVYTIHHDRDDKLSQVYARHRVAYVAISARQRELVPEAEDAGVIHHGLSPRRCPFGAGGRYALFLGRFARDKGVHVALDVARKAGVTLKLGGRPHWCDHSYYQAEVVPRLASATLVGEVGGAGKARLIADAAALLFPVAWEEPFGLVMIEAMLAGTPVLAFARGSVPEVVEEGVTGYICRDADEMTWRLRQIVAHGFNRHRCRTRALERWCARRMVREYLELYRSLCSWESIDARSAAPSL